MHNQFRRLDMSQARVIPLWLFVFSLAIMAGCTKEKKITEPVSTGIVGLASYSYTVNGRFITPSFQSITFSGYDEAGQISATFNNQPLRRRDNYNAPILAGTYNVTFNQSCTFNISIDGKSGTVTDTTPDTLFFTSHQNNALVPANQAVLLQWNNPRNTDFFFITARVEQGITFLFDSTFVATANQISLPATFFPAGTTTTIDVFAVAGLPARVTNGSNLQGDLRGRIYFYIRNGVFRLRGGVLGEPPAIPAAAFDDDYAVKKFKEFIGAD
jgi:hypothetical protein